MGRTPGKPAASISTTIRREIKAAVKREILEALEALGDILHPLQFHRGSVLYWTAFNTLSPNNGAIVSTTQIQTKNVTDAAALDTAIATAGSKSNLNAKQVYKTVYTTTNSYYYCFFSKDHDPVVMVILPDGTLYDDFPLSEA